MARFLSIRRFANSRVRVQAFLLAATALAAVLLSVNPPAVPIARSAGLPPRLTSTANVFVAPPASAGLKTHGNDDDNGNCRRFRTPQAAPPSGIGYGCATFDKAYSLAQAGDTVFLNWSGRWDNSGRDDRGIGPSSSKNSPAPCSGPNTTSGCIRLAPAPGQKPATSQMQLCANGIELDSLSFFSVLGSDAYGNQISDSGWNVGAGDNSCQPGGAPPHDIYVLNTTVNGLISIDGSAHNVYVKGGTIGNSLNVSNQLGGAGNNGDPSTGAPVNHVTIDSVTFTGMTWTDTTHHHPECLHMDFASDSVTIKNARFLGCESYAIRVEAEGDPSEHADAQTNHLFQNNFFDGQPLNFDCHDPGCVLSGITVRFNTIVSGISLTDDCKLNPDRTCTVTGNRLYGNIVAGSCPSNAAAYGLGWSQSYNLWSGSGGPNTICAHDSTSIYGNKAKLVAPGPPHFDDHLATHSQRALGLVPPQVTAGKPVTDIDGDLRPGRFSADAGADEWDSALMVLGRSIGGVRLGEREQDLLASYGQPNRRSTVSAGGARVTLLTYRLHGASLWVYTEGKRVVGIGTSSRYYALPTGVGVGGDAKLVRNWPAVSWLQCRRALRRVVGSTEILVSIPGGRNGATIGGITMVQKKYGFGACASRR